MHLFSCITVNMATCCYLENVAALLRSFFLCLIRYKSFSCLDIKLRPHLPILHTAVNRVDKIKHDENNNVMRIARYKKHKWFDSCSSSWVKQTFSRSHDTGRNLHLQGFWLWTSSDVLQLLFSCWTEKKNTNTMLWKSAIISGKLCLQNIWQCKMCWCVSARVSLWKNI